MQPLTNHVRGLMKKKIAYSLVLTGFMLLSSTASTYAQFLNLNLNVEPELKTQSVQPVDFSSFSLNDGVEKIDVTDERSGIFSIYGYAQQQVHVFLETPEKLTHTLQSREELPVNLQAAYNNFGENDPVNVIPFEEGSADFKIHENADIQTKTRSETYIYIFGEINVENSIPGNYAGEAVLKIEYE